VRLAIDTARMTLRPPEDRDAEAVTRILGDPDVARTAGSLPHPYPLESAFGWIAMAAVQHSLRRRFQFLMDLRGQGVAGSIGVFKRKPENDWEVGYSVSPDFRRQGLAREALTTILDWTRDDLGATRMIAGYFEDNAASGALLASAGFVPTGETIEVYSLGRGERARCVNLACELTPPQLERSHTEKRAS
jgi:RimJ/RimL family protein N-acetyltransferase